MEFHTLCRYVGYCMIWERISGNLMITFMRTRAKEKSCGAKLDMPRLEQNIFMTNTMRILGK